MRNRISWSSYKAQISQHFPEPGVQDKSLPKNNRRNERRFSVIDERRTPLEIFQEESLNRGYHTHTPPFPHPCSKLQNILVFTLNLCIHQSGRFAHLPGSRWKFT